MKIHPDTIRSRALNNSPQRAMGWGATATHGSQIARRISPPFNRKNTAQARGSLPRGRSFDNGGNIHQATPMMNWATPPSMNRWKYTGLAARIGGNTMIRPKPRIYPRSRAAIRWMRAARMNHRVNRGIFGF